MLRLLSLTGLFLAAIVFLADRPGTVTIVPAYTPGGPMGAGDAEGRNALRLWDTERMKDPATGRVPDDIRSKELAFARSLPHRAVAKSLNWTRQGPINRGGRTRAFRVDVSDPNVLLAGAATGGIWRSTDQGQNWTRTSAPLDIQNTSCLAQDVRAGRTQTWYCGTGENYGVVSGTSFEALLPGDGIFKSTDGGLSWNRLSSTVSNDPQIFDMKGAFKHVNSIVVDPVRNDSDVVVAAIYDGLVRSNDGGDSWHIVLGLDLNSNDSSLYTDVRVSPSGVYYAAIGRGASYRGVPRDCEGCHTDRHAGQFRLSTPERGCGDCHTTEAFTITPFDHAGLTGFALDGRHVALECIACHRETTLRDGTTAVAYRLGYRRCRDCHQSPHGSSGR